MDRIEPDDSSKGLDGAEPDGAERAFEALREEVAALRRGIELLDRQARQAALRGAGTPDYSPTLGAMEQALQAIAGRLVALERQPALQLTPESFQAAMDEVSGSAMAAAVKPLGEAVRQARAATADLQALAGRAHTRQEQVLWMWTAGVSGVMGGVLLWFLLAAFLPWGGGSWLAGLAFGGRWNAGQMMLEEANPASWERMMRLYKACPSDSTTELCEAAMAVRTVAPMPSAPSAPAAASVGPAPAQRGKGGSR